MMKQIIAKREKKRRLTVVKTQTTTTKVVKELKMDEGELTKVEIACSFAEHSQMVEVSAVDALVAASSEVGPRVAPALPDEVVQVVRTDGVVGKVAKSGGRQKMNGIGACVPQAVAAPRVQRPQRGELRALAHEK